MVNVTLCWDQHLLRSLYLHFMYRKYCIALVRTQALCHSKAFNCKPGFVRCIENASHLHTNEKILGMSSFKPALLNTQLALNQMCKNQIQSARFFSLFLKENYLSNDFTQVSLISQLTLCMVFALHKISP